MKKLLLLWLIVLFGCTTPHPFNQDISSWDVSKVQYMEAMFANSKFNQNLSSWNVSNVTNCGSFAHNTPDWTNYKPSFNNCSPD